jgi:type IV pilus assembly protein PilB
MYSALFARRRPELNIVTVEDPIEYHLDGITQVQVHTDNGSTFGSILRALLRQDPDVIMVGELRDSDTARMAVEASNTGHLVITSLHTNGAIEAIVRLLDLEVERYALSNSLACVLHQRLVRRICKECVEPFEYPMPILELLAKTGALRPGQEVTLYRGKGCQKCNGSGFRGRAALYEMLVVNDPVREAISKGIDGIQLKQIASAGALVDMSRYAGLLITAGVTVPGEVLQYLQQVDG